MLVRLIHVTPDYTGKIEFASRASTATKQGENSEDFVRRIVKRGHISVGRHCIATFEVRCSRVTSHQICRHPFLSIVQESQRYVTFDNDFIIPESIKNNREAKVFYKNTLDSIKSAYQELIEMKIPREDARYILSGACETRLVITSNFQGWADVIKLRTEKHTQWEFRQIMEEIRDILIAKAPAFFGTLAEEWKSQEEYKEWKKVQKKGEGKCQ